MAKITLDAETFKALASSTRLTVLRALDVRRKTLTELAKDLNLNKATVHEHLQILTQSGLVAKKDEGRKWIYYELTWRGQKILHPQETTTFSVLLGLGVLAAGGGVTMIGRAMDWWLQEHPLLESQSDPAPETADAPPEHDARITAMTADTSTTTAASTTAAPAAGSGTGTSSGTSSSEPPTYYSSTGTGHVSSSRAYGGTSTGSTDNLAAMEKEDKAPPAGPDTGTDFMEDGGWLGLALLGLSGLATTLAVLLRRRLRPAPFVPPRDGTEAP